MARLSHLSAAIVAATLSLAGAFELWVGCKDLRPSSSVIRWINNTWADGVSVGFPAIYDNVSDLTGLARGRGLRLAGGIHASLETMQRQLHDSDDSPDGAYAEAYRRELNDYVAATDGAKPFLWYGIVEDDSSGVGFPFEQLAVRPSTHADAWIQYDNYLQRAIALAKFVVTPSVAATPLIAQIGFGETAHAHFARGVALGLIERANDDVGDLNTALAFARGGARQFGAAWGIDLSWCVRESVMYYVS